jgi:hypothetical protein
MVASMTNLPVLGVPVLSKSLNGLDSLLSIVQMPGGIPVATFAIGASGPGVFMGCLMLGEKYPELHGVISAVAASMWDASALVFMIFNGVYFATAKAHERPVLGLDVIAFSWLGLTVPLGLLTLRVIPSLAEVHQLRGRGEGASDDQGDTRALTGAVDDSTDNTGSPPPSAGRGVPPTPTFASFFFADGR